MLESIDLGSTKTPSIEFSFSESVFCSLMKATGKDGLGKDGMKEEERGKRSGLTDSTSNVMLAPFMPRQKETSSSAQPSFHCEQCGAFLTLAEMADCAGSFPPWSPGTPRDVLGAATSGRILMEFHR